MAAEFPDLHHSINSLPAVLGSMLEIERAIKVIVEGCVNLKNDRATFERTLITQLAYRLPLGWDTRGGVKFTTRSSTSNPCLYLVVCPTSVAKDEIQPAKHGMRFRVELSQDPVVLDWMKSRSSIPA